MPGRRRRLAAIAGAAGLAMVLAPAGRAQTRTMRQDPARDNLRLPPGLATTELGRLGAVDRVGAGSRAVILIPGAGFGGTVFRPFADSMAAALDVTVHLVTLPGFGGSAPWPMPAVDTAYGATPWLGAAEDAILRYADSAGLARFDLVGHWIVGSQIAIRIAARHPDRVGHVALLAGVAVSYYESADDMRRWPAARRIGYAQQLGARWFRTVTEATWHDNNFMPWDYAVNPLQGMLLWRRASEPSLAAWIRYLLEFYATDVRPDLARLRMPVTVLMPGLDDDRLYVEPGRPYLRNLLQDSWAGIDSIAPNVRRIVVPGARAFPTHDRPAETLEALRRAGIGAPPLDPSG